jgi:hypothetical protein
MPFSNLTAYTPIAEGSEATPGLFNRIFSQLSDNIGTVNNAGIGLGFLSASTWASIGLQANSNNSDYIRFVDSANQRSTYRIGSAAGGTADGLNIFDESGNTLIASFSKQSIRFYQNVVGPVFDVGGALANTLNAATFGTAADSNESRIQAAINAASNSGLSRVYVPASMYPYSASSVSFIYPVQMVREGGNWAVYDVKAYGASGNSAANDQPAIMSGWSTILDQGGTLYMPAGTYKTTSKLVFSVTGSTPKACAVIGDASATIIRPSSAVTIGAILATDTNSDGITNRLYVHGINFEGSETTGATGIVIGENSGNLSGGIELEDLYIIRFQGAASKGIEVKNMLGLIANRVYIARCGTNLYVKGTDVSLPTTIRFHDSQFREAKTVNGGSGRGVDVVQAYRLVFDHCLFESNNAEGVYCAPSLSTMNAINMVFDDSWFEANYLGDASAATQYHFKMDGSAAGSVSVRVKDANFAGTARAIYLKSCVNSILDNVVPVNAANQIVIDTGCIGKIQNHPENNAPLATVLNNSSLTLFNGSPTDWYNKILYNSAGSLIPLNDNAYDFGTAGLRFHNMYLGNNMVVSGQGQFGTSPAQSGAVNLPYQGNISWRNSGNTGNIDILHQETNKIFGSTISLRITGDIVSGNAAQKLIGGSTSFAVMDFNSGRTNFGVTDAGDFEFCSSARTVSLKQNRLLSVRTLAASSITASAANASMMADEMTFTIGGASGASLCIHSGGTVYIFSSALSAKAT